MCHFLKGEFQIPSVLEVVHKFSDLAGPKLNKDRTEGLWLSKDNYRQTGCCIENIMWPKDPVRCLGIYIGIDLDKCKHMNWWSKLQKIEKNLISWNMRNLTISRKVTVINHLIVPNIIFPSQFLQIPNEFIKKFENIVYKFIWDSKDRVKHNTLIADITQGGLNLTNFDSKVKSLRATLIYRVLNDTADWTFLGKAYCNIFGPENLIWHFNFTECKQCPLIKTLLTFYQITVLSFNKSKQVKTPTSLHNLLSQLLWGNVIFIKYNRKTKQQETL